MKYFLSCFSLVFLLFSTSCGTSGKVSVDYKTKTYQERTAFFASNPLSEGQIVFFGNSITQGGNWASLFPDKDVANRGISGDNTEGMLMRTHEIALAKPEKIFIMAGVNDISQNIPARQIIENYRKIIQLIQVESPETEIIIQSVLPINNNFGRYKRLVGKEKQVTELNSQLRELTLTENATFINLFPFFADAEGKLKAELTGDGLHLKSEAYWLWANLIHRFIE